MALLPLLCTFASDFIAMATPLRHIRILFLCLWVAAPAWLQAYPLVGDSTCSLHMDSIQVSILTCTPGKDMYAKFGHTALRVRDLTVDEDVVFNYGCFDYNANNFVLKFLLGRTDYLLDAESFDFLRYRYGKLGNGVTEQVLNLNQQEANKLLALLLENMRPENQEYRYNWLYDNCTERARDMIEKAVDGEIVYAGVTDDDVTVRDMLHRCLEKSPWVAFGIDLILGEEIDRKVDKRIRMFLPDVFKNEMNGAHIVRKNGDRIDYVASNHQVMEDKNEPDAAFFLGSPLVLFSLLLLGAVTLLVQETKKGHPVEWIDVLVHTIQGLVGCLVAFLFFFSKHPAVDSNWLVIIFNPIPLFYAGWIIYCRRTGRKNRLAYANLAITGAFVVVMLFCPQTFNAAMWLLVLCLVARASSQAHFAYHNSQ